jgi:hypothetical protein
MPQYVPKPIQAPVVNRKPEMPTVFIIKKKRKVPPTMKTEPGIKAEQGELGTSTQPVIKKEKITGEGHIKEENRRMGPVQPLVVNSVLPPVVRGAGHDGACDGNIGKPKSGGVSTGKSLFKPRSEGVFGGQSFFKPASRNEEKGEKGKLDRKEPSSKGNKTFTNAVFVGITSD